ncbi:MAG: KpsF/GutQ family sugar-phosphate isomerase [Parachlamydiaceae bacterium]
MLKKLIESSKQNIDHFFQHLDLTQTEKLVDILEKCQGTLFFTGVGKSEIMAKKIAGTMTSTGTRALFMGATNALHGDIGILSAQDMLVMLSKGGESEELINLVPYVRHKGAKTIAIVSDQASRLSQMCDMHISLPLANELCPFNLAPTTSAQIQMIFGDLLTIALMHRKNFTLDQYAENHPSGKIGRRITTKVENLMLTGDLVPTCLPEDQTLKALIELSKKRCGCVLVVDPSRRLLGIYTDGDLGRTLNTHGPEALKRPIQELMKPNPRCISKTKLAWEALQQMEANSTSPVTVLAVTDENGHLEGLIKMHDILQARI